MYPLYAVDIPCSVGKIQFCLLASISSLIVANLSFNSSSLFKSAVLKGFRAASNVVSPFEYAQIEFMCVF